MKSTTGLRGPGIDLPSDVFAEHGAQDNEADLAFEQEVVHDAQAARTGCAAVLAQR